MQQENLECSTDLPSDRLLKRSRRDPHIDFGDVAIRNSFRSRKPLTSTVVGGVRSDGRSTCTGGDAAGHLRRTDLHLGWRGACWRSPNRLIVRTWQHSHQNKTSTPSSATNRPSKSPTYWRFCRHYVWPEGNLIATRPVFINRVGRDGNLLAAVLTEVLTSISRQSTEAIGLRSPQLHFQRVSREQAIRRRARPVSTSSDLA